MQYKGDVQKLAFKYFVSCVKEMISYSFNSCFACVHIAGQCVCTSIYQNNPTAESNVDCHQLYILHIGLEYYIKRHAKNIKLD